MNRTMTIIKLMTWAISTYMRGEKLQFMQGSHRLEKLGGIYIKFLQIIVLNLDPNDQKDYEELLSVYEHSQPDELDIRQYLRRQLPEHKLAQFESIETRPFATGSFGQVYRGKLKTGEQVVIKILRPSVQKYLYYDLRLLAIFSRLYNLAGRRNVINMRTVYKRFKQTCLEETDYVREATVATMYYDKFREHPYLVIPKTFTEISNSRVLVQDYLEGISVTEMLAVQTSTKNAREQVAERLGSDILWQLRVVGTELLGQAVTGDIMHADPHPGNIILLPNNHVALIDFGMSTHLSKNRYAFYQMLVQYVAFYSDELAIGDFGLSALHFLQPDLFDAIDQADKSGLIATRKPIIDKVGEAVDSIFHDKTNQAVIDQLLKRKMIMRVLFFTINKGNRFGFSFDMEAINLIKASQNFSVLAYQFDPEGEMVREVLRDVVKIAEDNLELVVDMKKSPADPSKALEDLSVWLDKVGRNDPWLMDQLAVGYWR